MLEPRSEGLDPRFEVCTRFLLGMYTYDYGHDIIYRVVHSRCAAEATGVFRMYPLGFIPKSLIFAAPLAMICSKSCMGPALQSEEILKLKLSCKLLFDLSATSMAYSDGGSVSMMRKDYT